MKNTLTILIGFLYTINLFCQMKVIEMELKPSKKKYSEALYNKITYLDARNNTDDFGYVYMNTKKKKSYILPKYEMERQVSNLLDSIIYSNAKNGKLLLQINHFTLSESEKNEVGTSSLKANMYAMVGLHAYKINSIDTTIKLESQYAEIGKVLVVNSANLLSQFITNCLYKPVIDSTDYPELFQQANKDSIEKSTILAYTTNELKDGIYYSFEAFKNQLPEDKCKVTVGEYEEITVDLFKTDGSKPITDKVAFIVVDKGRAFYNMGYDGYAELNKQNNDYYFIGSEYGGEDGGLILARFLLSGLGGSMYNPSLGTDVIRDTSKRKPVKMKLKYNSGSPIIIKQ
jgi:hypothetical protein